VLAGAVAVGLEEAGGDCVGDVLRLPETVPKGGRRGEGFEVAILACKKVVFDDAVTVGGVSELEAQDFGVVLGLLDAVTGALVGGFGFDDGDGEVVAIAEEVVGALLGTAGAGCSRWALTLGQRLAWQTE
jgi:hypothetical protein